MYIVYLPYFNRSPLSQDRGWRFIIVDRVVLSFLRFFFLLLDSFSTQREEKIAHTHVVQPGAIEDVL